MGKRRRYHHGDLRREILNASLALISEKGVGALSMRQVASRAGVTHGAPYHHFADRAAILAALAEEGFLILAEALRSALGDIPPSNHRGRFEAIGLTYFGFAVTHPAHFQLM